MVDCHGKTVVFKLPDQEVMIRGEKGYGFCNLISAAKIVKYIRKGYEAYLAHVIDTRKENPSVLEIPTVCDFPDRKSVV